MNVFISYSHQDRKFADKLAISLSKLGFSIWYDKWAMKPGDSLHGKIQNAIQQADYMIVVLSPSSVKSTWVQTELNAGLTIGMASSKVLVVPVLYRKCELPVFLKGIYYADFTTEFAAGLNVLLSRLLEHSEFNFQAVVLGAAGSGSKLITLLTQQSRPPVGVYDKRKDAPGIGLARELRVPVYYGEGQELLRLMSDCEGHPHIQYKFFLASKHKGFVTWVTSVFKANHPRNCTLFCMGEEFPVNFKSQDILDILMGI